MEIAYSLAEPSNADVMQEIIDQYARETGKHVDVVINEVARHYGVEEKTIKDQLKSIGSPFMDGTNRIVGYIDGKPVKRTTYHMSCIRIFRKIISGLEGVETFDPEDQNHVAFITEATYNYLKDNKSCKPDSMEAL